MPLLCELEDMVKVKYKKTSRGRFRREASVRRSELHAQIAENRSDPYMQAVEKDPNSTCGEREKIRTLYAYSGKRSELYEWTVGTNLNSLYGQWDKI